MKFFAVLFSAVILSGCGYTFQGSGSILPPDVKKVYIPSAENNTADATFAPLFTEALRDRFERFGVLSVVETIGEADAVLRTKVIALKRNSATSTSIQDATLQQDTSVALSGELRRVTGAILWRNPKLTVTRQYGTTSSSVLTTSAGFAGGNLSARDVANLDSRELSRGQEAEALANMAEEAAAKLYDEAVTPDF